MEAYIMHGVEDSEWLILNYVEMKPGVRVYVTDRDNGNWDCEGVIVKAPLRGEGKNTFDVKFKYSTSTLDYDQIEPTQEEQQKPEAQARRRLHQMTVFLCHASEDKVAVRDLHTKLRAADLNPWLDEIDIPPGAEWDAAIRKAIRSSDIVLVCLSSTSVGKTGYVQKEVRFALDRADEKPEGEVYIIPVKLDECVVPTRLSPWQWVSLFEPRGYERLMSALRNYAGQGVH
jgi:hypothetical protein